MKRKPKSKRPASRSAPRPPVVRRPVPRAAPKGAPSRNVGKRGAPTRTLKSKSVPRRAFLKRRQRAEILVVKSARVVTPPRRFKRGRKPSPYIPVVITFFKARGSVEGRFRKSPGGLIQRERARDAYFELQSEAPPGFPNAPGVWASNESLFLGQVNFPGRVKRSMLEEMLNRALGLVDRRGKLHSFKTVYKRWEMKYQIFEKFGPGKDETRILKMFKDRND